MVLRSWRQGFGVVMVVVTIVVIVVAVAAAAAATSRLKTTLKAQHHIPENAQPTLQIRIESKLYIDKETAA